MLLNMNHSSKSSGRLYLVPWEGFGWETHLEKKKKMACNPVYPPWKFAKSFLLVDTFSSVCFLQKVPGFQRL